jgi:hypothetical protein
MAAGADAADHQLLAVGSRCAALADAKPCRADLVCAARHSCLSLRYLHPLAFLFHARAAQRTHSRGLPWLRRRVQPQAWSGDEGVITMRSSVIADGRLCLSWNSSHNPELHILFLFVCRWSATRAFGRVREFVARDRGATNTEFAVPGLGRDWPSGAWGAMPLASTKLFGVIRR